MHLNLQRPQRAPLSANFTATAHLLRHTRAHTYFRLLSLSPSATPPSPPPPFPFLSLPHTLATLHPVSAAFVLNYKKKRKKETKRCITLLLPVKNMLPYTAYHDEAWNTCLHHDIYSTALKQDVIEITNVHMQHESILTESNRRPSENIYTCSRWKKSTN